LAYAKVREQFGRTIGTFQAVKHHLADMLVAAEPAVAIVWDAARAHADSEQEFELMAACAATVAFAAYTANAEMHLHLHGGIGYTWEHDAHLHLRRAATVQGLLGGEAAPERVFALSRAGVVRENSLELPESAEQVRAQVRSDIAGWSDLDAPALRQEMIRTGLLVPHWPPPWGRGADAVEQVVIEQELAAAGVERPDLSIGGWVILTLTQHGSPDQIERFVQPALRGDEIWCQLFSEPGAGSDAAAVSTKGTRVEGGWLVSGQKVWTSLAHECHRGLATVRTDASAAKHAGVTTMIIDMAAPGVEVRPLKQITGGSEFNEVFLSDVFVPDHDVVGEAGQGWTVARATLGNERVSIGGASSGDNRDVNSLITLVERHRGAHPDAVESAGRSIATVHALRLLNLRSAARSLAGSGPGPEGNVTKLLRTLHVARRTSLAARLIGPEIAFASGEARKVNTMVLAARAYAIAGGTTEIAKNQIAERILGLPRDPLLK
jgi:alkylation response protein AidB-like acyl-CoA dehydrogenase